jgi:hypothetical protein
MIWPSAADKGKEVIISDARGAEENSKISCRKVVAERTLDGGETLKVTITTSNAGGQVQAGSQARPLFCASRTVRRIDVNGMGHHRTVLIFLADGPATPRSSDDHEPSSLNDQK